MEQKKARLFILYFKCLNKIFVCFKVDLIIVRYDIRTKIC